MLQLALAVQKVEIVGGESWWEHSTVALAAIGAASLAALVAILNRRAELKHDREMRNRDHIREILDSSYQEVGEAVKKVSDLMGVVLGTEAWRATPQGQTVDGAQLIEEANRELAAVREVAHSTFPDLLRANSRLEMRLGREHPVAVAHDKVRLAINALYDQAPPSLASDREQEVREADDRLREEAGVAYADFREACFRWLNE
jgi:hypothetical protein